MIHFILNDTTIATDIPDGTAVLDFIRYHRSLMGTKIGCREGDCGACTVLVGELNNDSLRYRSATSCLMPIRNAAGKHIVTIEGINFEGSLNAVQQAMADAGATQCGFCTPGFVMSLTGYCISAEHPDKDAAIAAMDGNICRCTGYKSIQRAAGEMVSQLNNRGNSTPLAHACSEKFVPDYFLSIASRLKELPAKETAQPPRSSRVFTGGGTDLYVQRHDEMEDASIEPLFDAEGMNFIRQENDRIIIGPSVTVSDLRASELFNEIFPDFSEHSKLVSSTPIRNMATLAGNFINASPIGDFTIYFLALDAHLTLSDGENKRDVPLRSLYKGYKQLDRQSGEMIESIYFRRPSSGARFNFEKVSKRTHLDIASVNSAMMVEMKGNMIVTASVSAGGVGPVPMFLPKTSAFLAGKDPDPKILAEAIALATKEIKPISDARGSADYKSLLLGQLIKSHFLKLFSSVIDRSSLVKL